MQDRLFRSICTLAALPPCNDSDSDKFNVDLMFIVTDCLTQASFKTPNDFHIILEMNGNKQKPGAVGKIQKKWSGKKCKHGGILH